MARNRPKPRHRSGPPPAAEQQQKARITVSLAGRQNIAMAVHDAAGGGPVSVNVMVGRAELVFRDSAAAAFVAGRWAEMAGLAAKLPAEWERTTPVAPGRTPETGGERAGGAVGEAVAFRVADQVKVTGRVVKPRGHTSWLQLQIGPVQFSVRDITAFRTTGAGLLRGAKLASVFLPETAPAPGSATTATPTMRPALETSLRQTATNRAASALGGPSSTPSASGSAHGPASGDPAPHPGRSANPPRVAAPPPPGSRPVRATTPGPARPAPGAETTRGRTL
jgi:hypothetical protein